MDNEEREYACVIRLRRSDKNKRYIKNSEVTIFENKKYEHLLSFKESHYKVGKDML